jgi:hypothetical protein
MLPTGAVVFLEGCTPSSWLQEADDILLLLAPLGDGVLSILAVADPLEAIRITPLSKVYDTDTAAVEKFLADESVALLAAQPSIIAQLQALVATLHTDSLSLIQAAQVKNTTVQAEIQAITGSILLEIGAILTVIPSILASGVAGVTGATGQKIKAGMVPKNYQSAKTVRGNLVKRLATPTGDAAIDAKCLALSQKLAALTLK